MLHVLNAITARQHQQTRNGEIGHYEVNLHFAFRLTTEDCCDDNDDDNDDDGVNRLMMTMMIVSLKSYSLEIMWFQSIKEQFTHHVDGIDWANAVDKHVSVNHRWFHCKTRKYRN